ncbi:MAG: tetratricopeptide repeat protein, partial [bacterium]
MLKQLLLLFILLPTISMATTTAVSQVPVPNKFIIAIAEIGKGPDNLESESGKEITRLIVRELKEKFSKFNETAIETIIIERIKNNDEAAALGKKYGASLIVWGWIPVATQDAFIPNFKVVNEIKGMEMISQKEFSARLRGVDSFTLSDVICERASMLSSFLIGIAHYSGKEYKEALFELNAVRGGLTGKESSFANGGFFDSKGIALYLGNIHLYQKAYELAIKEYDRAIMLDPCYGKAWYNKAIALTNLSRYRDALICYNETIRLLNEGCLDAWYQKAAVLSMLGRFQDALVVYEQVSMLEPDSVDALYRKGLTLCKLGEMKRAIDCLDEAVKLKPALPILANIFYTKGTLLEEQKRYEDSIVCYDACLKLQMQNSSCWQHKAIAFERLDKKTDAIFCYDNFLSLEPNNIDALYAKSVLLYEVKNYEIANKCLDKLLGVSPKHLGAWKQKGLALSSLGKYDEAIRCFEQTSVDGVTPLSADVLYSKSIALLELNRSDEAITCLDKVLAQQPANTDALFSKALLLQKMGRK